MTRGRKTPVAPKDIAGFEALAHRTQKELIALGLRIWQKKSHQVQWVYPVEWYRKIPDGMHIVTISGRVEVFRKDFTSDDDLGTGVLPYGFIQKV